MSDSTFLVQMEQIVKSFGGVHALRDVSFSLKKGEIHALVGENGAGKSTLMKILSGAVAKDGGDIMIDGKTVDISSPRKSMDLGISVIYQEFMLAPHLTVAENIFIDRLTNNRAFINWKKLNSDAKKLISKLGFDDIEPAALVGSLPVAYQQVVEICKSLSRNAKILVLDEPSAVLTFSEIKKLFSLLRSLRDQGIGIVYISHRLDEIFELCDSITVLKDGMLVRHVNTGDIDKKSLINLMVGRELSTLFPERHATIGEKILEAEHISAGKMVKDVSFFVKQGEVLGISGLVGAGRTETMRAMLGIDRKDGGRVVYKSKERHFKSSAESVHAKIGFLSEDRKQQGVLLDQSIRINTTLTSLKKVGRFGVINMKKDREFAFEILHKLSTKYGSIDDPVSSLSGGNQQKVSLAKWLAADCECIVLDEPTRGVDAWAKTEIYKCINDLAEMGIAVIMISSEMEEIIGMCDRTLIMRLGSIVGELKKGEIKEESLIQLSMGVM
jgi:ribose transport system ATP-binding protein